MALVGGGRRAQFAKAILSVLNSADDGMTARDVVQAVSVSVPPTEVETHRYESGPSRFETHLRFTSTKLAKADMLRKANGKWYISDEGRIQASLDAEQLYALVRARYAEWRNLNQSDSTPDSIESVGDIEPTHKDSIQLNLEAAQESAHAEIRQSVLGLGSYEFQDLVAALLRGMGYQTPFVAPRGPDGGTDILAYLDPIGASTPHIRVQVKHRKQDKARNDEIASLLGNLNPQREIGLFVSTSGFTKEAERQMQRGQTHMELIDLDRFIELWIDHYGKLSDEDKMRLPLQPVYFLAPGAI